MTVDEAILLALNLEEEWNETLIVYRLGRNYDVGLNAPRGSEKILKIENGRMFAILNEAA